jgi:hypothetical protein
VAAEFDWIIETLDGEDVIDVDHAAYLLDFGDRMYEAFADPSRFQIGLKRTLQVGRLTHISYAYHLGDGVLDSLMAGDLSAHTPRSKRVELAQAWSVRNGPR